MKFLSEHILSQVPEALLPWYRIHARDLPWRRTRDPYRVWLSEIMLQQTRVEAAKGHYARFLEALPTIEDLAQVDDDRLMKLWEGLGYYNRAKNLKLTAILIMSTHGGHFPQTHGEILSLPGIGPYTAGAVSSICFGLPYPAVDGNVFRVYARLTALADSVDLPAVKKRITDDISAILPVADPATFNQALMELGALVCLPVGAPHCDVCPLAHLCQAKASGTQLEYPVRLKKKARRIEEKTVFILTSAEALAVEKRDAGGLLGGLWALPNVPGILGENEALALVKSWGVEPVELTKASQKKHIFTHVEWHMRGYYLECRIQSSDFTWADAQQRANQVALPTAFRQFLD